MATQAFDELAETFEFLDTWEDRYRHVIELGRDMAQMPDALKTPATKVDGCASQVWLHPVVSGSGAQATFDFLGDSDAMIVRGLIAVLHRLYSGLTLEQVLQVDAPAELARLGLDAHLSAQRSNGVRAMIGRVRSVAEAGRAQ